MPFPRTGLHEGIHDPARHRPIRVLRPDIARIVGHHRPELGKIHHIERHPFGAEVFRLIGVEFDAAGFHIIANIGNFLLLGIVDLEDDMAIIDGQMKRDIPCLHRFDDGHDPFVFFAPAIHMKFEAEGDIDGIARFGGSEISVDDLVVGQLMPVRGKGAEHDIDHFHSGPGRVPHALGELLVITAQLVNVISRDHRDTGFVGRRDAGAQ